MRAEPSAATVDDDHFHVDQDLQQIHFKNDPQREVLEGIPSIHGSVFRLQGERQILIAPQMFGTIRFYSHLYLEGQPGGQAIELVMESLRKGNRREIRRIKESYFSQDVFLDLEIKRDDRIAMRFAGNGIVYFSQPILYQKLSVDKAAGCDHIIVIGIDTFRGDHLGKGIIGQQPSLTPNLDRFRQDAVYLENAYAQTNWTLPSFMSLFTARNEYNHGVGVKSPLRPEQQFLVENLAREFITFGYHGGMAVANERGFARGFDHYRTFMRQYPGYPQEGRLLFAEAEKLLRQGRFPKLFLFLHTYQLHCPYYPPKEFLSQVNPHSVYDRLDSIPIHSPARTYEPASAELTNAYQELYQAEVLAFDSYFGEFIAHLKEMRLYERSLIVVMSDHGEEFYEHHGWAHAHSLYNEEIRVPLIIKFPQNKFRNTRLKEPVGVVDILPTLLSHCGIPYAAAGLDGVNLLPLIQGDKSFRRKPVVSSVSTGKFFEHFPNRVALVFGQFKLIFNEPYTAKALKIFAPFGHPAPFKSLELYDLRNDPGETVNLIKRLPKIRSQMMPLLRQIKNAIDRQETALRARVMDEKTKKMLQTLGYL